MTNLSAYSTALTNLTRRPTIMTPSGALRAAITSSRYVELHDADAAGSALWAVGSLEISGKLVETHLFVGDVFEPASIMKKTRLAAASLAETISGGSRAATLLAEGVASTGRRAFVYSKIDLDPDHVSRRLADYIARNGIATNGGAEVDAKPTRKSKKAVA